MLQKTRRNTLPATTMKAVPVSAAARRWRHSATRCGPAHRRSWLPRACSNRAAISPRQFSVFARDHAERRSFLPVFRQLLDTLKFAGELSLVFLAGNSVQLASLIFPNGPTRTRGWPQWFRRAVASRLRMQSPIWPGRSVHQAPVPADTRLELCQQLGPAQLQFEQFRL